MLTPEGKVVFEKLAQDIHDLIENACKGAKLSNDDKMEIIEDLGVSLEEHREEIESAEDDEEGEEDDDEDDDAEAE